jgi:putative nucleotidyltransferase with HDIG domain
LAAPFALGPLLAALLLPARLAVILSFCLSLAVGVISDFSLVACAASAFGGAIAVALGRTVRTRSHVTQAGLKIGAVQALTVLVLGSTSGWPLGVLLWQASWAAMGGVLASLLALGLLPYVESFFSRLSPIQLIEMSDLNHPLLKRMSLEAPGTYHHSLIMATLADAAAAAIGANNLLARVGAYFHDIGKLMKPEYFVENQGGSKNPHDGVSPAMSRLVITSHVKEGLALAERYRIDKSISAFIPMHHGTSKVEYFYRKAAEAGSEEPPEEQSFRYPGPRPRTKETAIVMLADSIEAAARTLEEPNHQRFQDLVYRLVNRKLFDGQLDEAPLTLRDLRTISDTFVTTLMGIYHARIKYPALENPPGGRITEIRPPSSPGRDA